MSILGPCRSYKKDSTWVHHYKLDKALSAGTELAGLLIGNDESGFSEGTIIIEMAGYGVHRDTNLTL